MHVILSKARLAVEKIPTFSSTVNNLHFIILLPKHVCVFKNQIRLEIINTSTASIINTYSI